YDAVLIADTDGEACACPLRAAAGGKVHVQRVPCAEETRHIVRVRDPRHVRTGELRARHPIEAGTVTLVVEVLNAPALAVKIAELTVRSLPVEVLVLRQVLHVVPGVARSEPRLDLAIG